MQKASRSKSNPYRKLQLNARNIADMERRIFSEAARLLNVACDENATAADKRIALKFCLKLWSIVEMEMGDDACKLQLEVRAGILDLAQYVQREAILCSATHDIKILETLRDININFTPTSAQTTSGPEQLESEPKPQTPIKTITA